jgi:DNA-binding SARP family transcriptional activator
VLHLGQDEVDLHQFQEALRNGRSKLRSGLAEEAGSTLESAIRLWRGPALGGLRGGPIVDNFVTWVEEARLECLEMMVEANFRQGRHREMLSMLYALVSEHPLRESFYRQLILALRRADRQADALHIYQRARGMIRNQLGWDPGRGPRAPRATAGHPSCQPV